MRPIYALLTFAIISLICIAVVVLTPMDTNPTGMAHETITGMRVVGDGAPRYEAIATPGIIVQCMTLLIYVSLMVIGVSPQRRTRKFWTIMGIGAALALIVWAIVISLYQDFLATGETTFIWGFPAPTAWASYGIWATGAYFTGVYYFCYREFFFTHEEEAEFDAFVASLNDGEQA